jgi:rhodanese-related sulfurtransferase
MTGLAALIAAVVSLVWSAPPAVGAADMLSVQESILRAKPATVLVISEVATEVTLDCGSGPTRITPPPFRETGTGWFVDTNGWVITNAHVVQPAHAPPQWLVNQQGQRAVLSACIPEILAKRKLQPGERPDVEEQIKRDVLDRVLPKSKVELNPSVSILMSNGIRLPTKVTKYSPPVAVEGGPGAMSGRDLALLQVEASDLPVFALGDSRSLKIGDPIRILGFPGVVLTHELLNASAKVEASVTNGAVSGFKQDVQNQPVIQTDAPAAWGNSGGPVVNEKGDVVGVLTFVSLAPGPEGSIVQGFNFVIPADAVRDFLKGTDVAPTGKSPFNDAWFSGLRRLFTGDYTGAGMAFREANRLMPDLPDVGRALAEAQEKIKNPPPRPFPWAVATGAVVVLSLGLVAVLAGRRWRHGRHRVSPADVVRLFEDGRAPLIFDVRARFVYDTSPFRIPGAVHLAPEDLERGAAPAPSEPARPVVAYCTSKDERTSAGVAAQLRKLGYRDVRILRGGLGSWTNAGLPLEAKATASAPSEALAGAPVAG